MAKQMIMKIWAISTSSFLSTSVTRLCDYVKNLGLDPTINKIGRARQATVTLVSQLDSILFSYFIFINDRIHILIYKNTNEDVKY